MNSYWDKLTWYKWWPNFRLRCWNTCKAIRTRDWKRLRRDIPLWAHLFKVCPLWRIFRKQS